MSYSPGPWKVWGESIRQPEGIAIGQGDAGYSLARVFSQGHDGEANARLIAAAPELLEALEEAEYRLRELAHQVWPQGVSYYEPAVVKARAAIAKAKGEQ